MNHEWMSLEDAYNFMLGRVTLGSVEVTDDGFFVDERGRYMLVKTRPDCVARAVYIDDEIDALIRETQ